MGLETFNDGIRRGDEVLFEEIVGALEKLGIRRSDVLGQNFERELFVLFMKGDAFDMGTDEAHRRLAVFLYVFAAGDHRCGWKNDFFTRIDQNAVTSTFRLDIGGIGRASAPSIDTGKKRLQPFGVGADR